MLKLLPNPGVQADPHRRSRPVGFPGIARAGGIVVVFAFLAVGLTAALRLDAATVNVDCNKGRRVGRLLSKLKPGDVVFLQGTCRENIVIQPEVPRITLDGQSKAIVDATN